MTLRIPILILAIMLGRGVSAEGAAAPVESKSRDKSAAFVATQNFIVGRIGRDCLEELRRSETPLEYQQKWQRDNAKYYEAMQKYMTARLSEIEDGDERDRVERAYYASATKSGEAATQRLFSQGPKSEVCKYAITLVDTGSMDIEEFGKVTRLPIMKDLDELLEWAKGN